MWRAAAFIACVAMAAAAPGHAQADGTADDDLAVVKRAVEKEDGGATPRVNARRSPGKARWFRVRIEERNGSKVKINLPLGLVRAVGDDLPVDWGCRRRHRGCRMSLTEVLDLLDAGQDLVEIEDSKATVRIWVE